MSELGYLIVTLHTQYNVSVGKVGFRVVRNRTCRKDKGGGGRGQ